MKQVNRILQTALLFMSAIFLMTSCTKDLLNKGDINGIGEKLPSNSRPNPYEQLFDGMDVYVVGKEGNYATLWKNGVATRLSNGTKPANAKSIFIDNGTVYIAGVEDGKARLWVNGTGQNLIYGTVANSVAVKDGDVYVAGYAYHEYYSQDEKYAITGTLWKNGVLTDQNELPESLIDKLYSTASNLFVSGQDIYHSKYSYVDFYQMAAIFKNGVAIKSLPEGNEMSPDPVYINSLFVQGNNIYAVGDQDFQPFYLKNDNLTILSSAPGQKAKANSIFVANRSVYIAGDEGTRAKLWVNNNASYITGMNHASSIYIFGDKVFVAGSGSDLLPKSPIFARLYVNGTVINLSSGVAEATANDIVVVPGAGKK